MRFTMLPAFASCCLLAFLCSALPSDAQSLDLPRVSPRASISQWVGLSKISIDYHRPAVKGREIWGGLVPYNNGVPMPWRAGANDNTTISFSHDATINGKKLAAGSYGLHMIPSAKDWTIIFSKNHTSWGSFNYKAEEDALRITVRPEAAEHEEWLRYGFEKLTGTQAFVYLHWEKLKVGFEVGFESNSVVLANLRNQMRHLAGWNTQSLLQAAAWCLQQDINHDEALVWADRSIKFEKKFSNLSVKAQLLAKKGQSDDAENLMKQAVEIANEGELNFYGYQLLGRDELEKAIEIFSLNVERHPESWNVYDSLAEAYQKKGETKKAISYYTTALEKAPDNQSPRIKAALKQLGAKS